MRTLRWAAESAVDANDARSELGVDQLLALAGSNLLDQTGQSFVDAALDTVLSEPVTELEQDQDAEVVELIINDSLAPSDEDLQDLSSVEGPREPEGGGDG